MRILTLILSVLLIVSPVYSETVIEINNFDELKTAWYGPTRTDDCTFVIKSMINFNNEWLKPAASEKTLTMFFEEGAGFDFNAAYLGSEKEPRNGIQYRGQALDIIGGIFQNFNVQGSAIRGDQPKSVSIRDATFRNIGNTVYLPKNRPVKVATDTVYTQAIAAYDASTTVRVDHCYFENCATNSHTWSHCIYVVVDKVYINNCVFRRCGSPYAIAGATKCLVVNCDVDEGVLCDHSEGQWDYSYVWYIGSTDITKPFVTINNRIAGYFGCYTSLIGLTPGLHIFDNDVQGIIQATRYFARAGNKFYTKEEWQAEGHDTRTVATKPAP